MSRRPSDGVVYAGPVDRLRLAACQLNLVVGDLSGNTDRILKALAEAEEAGCDVAVFPELSITGYPPEDLVLKPGFVAAQRLALEQIASHTSSCAAVVGFVDEGRDLYNAAALCANGEIAGVAHKRLLPNYGVFDEKRYFAPGVEPFTLFEIAGVAVGVSICEDAWSPTGPIYDLAAGGADVILNINASPYRAGKWREREQLMAARASDSSCAIAYVNLVGGQDELIFDGGSFVVDRDGEILTRSKQLAEQVQAVDIDVRSVYRKRMLDPRDRPMVEPLPIIPVSGANERSGEPLLPEPEPRLDRLTEIYEALVLATRDYLHKNGFSEVVIGLSGGIDSTLVAAIAADALGPENCHGVMMPSRFSSDHSVSDAVKLAENLRIDHRRIEIEQAHSAFESLLAPSFAGLESGLAEENIQSRVRGVLLMALSNKLGWMVLTTSNKSESAVGYATLYGDTAGGFAVIKDVPKLLVYELCRHRNVVAGWEVIPETVMTKPPSAELRPDQRDDQSLPPYEVLDPILAAYVEEDWSVAEIEAAGYAPDVVARVVGLVDRAEYKRRQVAPGPRISSRAFGKDRRLPITNHYRG